MPKKKATKKKAAPKRRKKPPQRPSITLSGTTYFLSHPDREGMELIAKRIRSIRQSPLAVATRHLDGLGAEDRKALLAAALEREAAIPDYVGQHEYAQFLDTPEGVAMSLWLCLRGQHDISEERVSELLDQAGDELLEEVMAQRDKLMEG